ncbi:MAG TPA: DUF488 domain-containing protein [Firmicutes bacterium]|nr:DUF488 domain-containing protein [Bacillota bacterium]
MNPGNSPPESEFKYTAYTIGHSNIEIEQFLELLKQHEIQILVDVRSSPYSKFAVQYNRDNIEHLVERANVEYQFFGSVLGGKPSNPDFYDKDGRVLYGKIAETEEFQDGISHLVQLIRNYTVAIMCSEENPAGCHRRLLITRVLMEHGIDVIHIRSDGTTISERDLRESEELEKDKGQLSMFESKEQDEWKSIR